MTGYCLKCKKKIEIVNEEVVIMKNGLTASKGNCPDCNTKVFRFHSKPKVKVPPAQEAPKEEVKTEAPKEEPITDKATETLPPKAGQVSETANPSGVGTKTELPKEEAVTKEPAKNEEADDLF